MVLKVTDLPKLIGLLQRLSDRGERIAKLVKVQADVEASYASKFIVGDESS
jgi:hypothetical protein